MAKVFVVEVAPGAEEAALAHRCPDGTDAPIPYAIGPRARARLAGGESVPATARCRLCSGRAFASLVDPAARAVHRAAARRDPAALKPPERSGRGGAPGVARPAAAQRGPGRIIQFPGVARAVEPCPACGLVPDSFGMCRCSQ